MSKGQEEARGAQVEQMQLLVGQLKQRIDCGIQAGAII